jgi:hypothetical protein
LGFRWKVRTWEDRLSELADYRKIYGTAMFLRASENTAGSLGPQPRGHNTGCTRKERIDDFPYPGIESLGLGRFGAAWEDRLSELADYRKIQGHCNVPWGYSENTGLATWVYNRGRNTGCTEGKLIAYDKLPYPGIGSMGFRMGQVQRLPGKTV